MTTTPKRIDDALLAAATGGSGPLDPLLYTGDSNPVLNPLPTGEGTLLTTGEGTASDTVEGRPVP